ncbi:ABC transporter substrate-binding protein [Bailinhaonella thermotolerans]|uniref:ABC transporter substrate-binding protein n=1 Tax=Bailinhaonella thermotolerans TaxID=1070861 RepID=A0A3A4BAR4_9ACTN|nr:ABC transporter substrate-binding protein [Bailinhaonella thermotolerans]RJL36019.1 ABC transporter substrate-binding protein [Bailinhaonella thermotolerans]
MIRKNALAAVALGATLAVGLSACGGGGPAKGKGPGGGQGQGAGFNAADKDWVNRSDKKGGTLKLVSSQDWDSPDPQNTYYAWSVNFARVYGRQLTTFKSAPGTAGLEVVPDLAESLGEVSPDGKTITYRLKPGLKFDDGSPITSKDVKYGIARMFDRQVLPNGPDYFVLFIDNGGKKFEGPYKDKELKNLTGIQTPDDRTIVFKLTQAFPDFDYLATFPQTTPVPQAKDTGAKYLEKIVASGPYKIDSYQPGKGMQLSRNPHWDPASDPNRKQLVDKIEVQVGLNQDDIDNRLLSGAAHIDVRAVGVGPAAQAKILANPQLKANADSTFTGRLWYFTLNEKIAPFDNIECRKAVQYATDKVALQTAFGGPIAGGDVATTMLPPSVAGYQKFDLYPTPGHKGDLAKAKQHLTACGQPNGFTTKISARADRPTEMRAAEALQQSLQKIGIQTSIKSFPSDRYFTNFAGSPAYVKKEKIGISFHGWHADWPTGFGFLQQLVDGRTIKAQGNTNVQETDDPKINALFDQVTKTKDTTAREKIYGQIDRLQMERASTVPYQYSKGLFYRNPQVANVYFNYAYGEYDYANLSLR